MPHPGIVEIVKKTQSIFQDKDIALVGGGFHLVEHQPEQIMDISETLQQLNVNKIAPSHCTGERAIKIFKEVWGERYIELHLGDTVKLGQA